MTIAPELLAQYVRMDSGEIDRHIFTDQNIFDVEMREIFGRAWLFLCHESQIPKAGDFVETPMGQDNVLVVRQRDKSIKAFINSCTHRGNAVCRAEEGNAKNFMCTYHGWTFDIGGELVGVPGMEKFYGNRLDKQQHALKKVAQLDSYKGFVFATFDPKAPALYDFLGAAGRLGMDLIAVQDMEAVPGIQKFIIDCNWKFTVDNLFDWYHPQISHMSATYTGMFPEDAYDAFLVDTAQDGGGAETPDGKKLVVGGGDFNYVDNLVVIGEYGHAIAGPHVSVRNASLNLWRERSGVAEILGPVGMQVDGHPNIFPTLWVTTYGQLSLRIPRSPTQTEIWWYSFAPKASTPEERAALLDMHNHVFGPAGILEQEDGENWAQSTQQSFGEQSSQIPNALRMNVGNGKIIHEHGLARIEGFTNEHAQLWTYGAWAAWMSGCDWDELRSLTTHGDVI
jgi:nitrite reductase/ring-hydroxylating ferredoxin subunit